MKTCKTINWAIFVSIMVLTVKMPLELIGAVVWIAQHVYIFVEFVLDEIVTLAFDTDSRSTEIIVFYIMLGIGAAMVLALFSYVADGWRQAKQAATAWCSEQKAQMHYAWQTSPWIKKSKVVCSVALCGSFAAMMALN